MNIKIRAAVIDDSERILELLKQIGDLHGAGRPDVFRDDVVKYNIKELREIFENPDKRVFVAEVDSVVCGYVFCEILNFENHKVFKNYRALYVDDLCVDKDFRNMGIGSALFEKCKEFAKQADCYCVELNVWEFNGSAVEFYEKCGMTAQRRRMEYILKD
jgi:ribosomal protein S18 acetylase RimI-like enzyme